MQIENSNAQITSETMLIGNMVLVAGCFVTFKSQIVTDSGRILVNKGEKREVVEILKTPGFYGKKTGQWHNEKIDGVKVKGLRGYWLLSTFTEVFSACH